MQRAKQRASKQFVLRCLESNCQWVSTRCERRGRDLKFLSDHSLLLTDGNQPTPDQTMLNSDHSHCGISDDRKHRVMTTAFKYNKLLSYLGWDESTPESGVQIVHKWLRNRQLIWWKIKRINIGVFWTSLHLRMLFYMLVSLEMVNFVVFLTLLLLGEPTRHHMGRIYFTNIDYTNYTLLIMC